MCARVYTVTATVLAGSMLSVVVWLIWSHRRKKKLKRTIINEVLFFPDSGSTQLLSESSNHLLLPPDQEESLKAQNTDHKGSLWELFKGLQQAKHSISVCMLTIASRELGDILISAHQAGVIVRVVTNDEQLMFSGTQVNRLRRAGIQVRVDTTAFLMHHKFVVVDGELLMSGSLNWTTQALCGNQENIIVTSEPKLVEPFINQFEMLWKQYNPQDGT
jgi:cardiolipin hydrolase